MYVNWNLFDSIFPNWYEFKTPTWYDVKETGDELSLKIIIPGYRKDDFNLFVEDGELFLDIESGKDTRHYSIVSQLFSYKYNFSKAEAIYDAGILKVTVPKTEKKSQKRIAIGVS